MKKRFYRLIYQKTTETITPYDQSTLLITLWSNHNEIINKLKRHQANRFDPFSIFTNPLLTIPH